MISEWQPMELPLGSGVDTHGNLAQLPPGKLRNGKNLVFNKDKKLTKRFGFDKRLGAPFGGPGELAPHNEHLLAFIEQRLYDYGKTADVWVDRGPFRAVPSSGEIVQSSNANLSAVDAYTCNGYTCVAWYDGTNLTAEIIDEGTKTVLTFQKVATSALRQVIGIASGGTTYFYVVTGRTIYTATVVTGAVTWNLVGTSLGSASADSCNVTTDGTSLYAIYRDSTNVTVVKLSTALANVWTHAGLFTSALFPICALSVIGTVLFVGCNASAASLIAATGATSGAAVSLTTGWQHVCIVDNGDGAGHYVFDDAAHIGTNVSTVSHAVVNANGTTSGTTVLMRSCSLAAGGVRYNGVTYVGLTYYSKIIPNLAGAIAVGTQLPDGSVFTAADQAALEIPVVSSCFLMVSLDGTICSRNFRGTALVQNATGSMSLTGEHTAVCPARVMSRAETLTIQQAVNLGAAGLIRFKLGDEKFRTTQAFRVLSSSGGLPMSFDDTSAAEQGFSVYPEIFGSAAQDNAQLPATALSLFGGAFRPTSYTVGQIVTVRGLTGVAAGHVYMCVGAGTTGTAVPTMPTNGTTVVDGTVTWLDIGFDTPMSFQDFPFGVGLTVVPSTPNGFIYVCTASPGGFDSPGTEPAWPTVVGQTCHPGNTSFTFTCAGTWDFMEPTTDQLNAGYGYAACYSRVNAKGQLERSAASPIMTFTLPVPAQYTSGLPYGKCANVALAVTTLRITQKTDVRIDIFRTDKNGTLLQQIASLPNNPATDAVAFIDTVPDATQEIGSILYQGSFGSSELPNFPPPPCSSICAWGSRLACNDLENPYALHVSKLVVDGYAPAWADQLVLMLNGQYGALNALVQMDDKLVLFQDRAVSVLVGEGPDNTGGGTAFGQIQAVATDVGCSNPDSVLLTPMGVVFQSAKGIYLLDRSCGTNFIGEEIADDLTDEIVSSAVDPTTQQLLFLMPDGTLFVFDYEKRAWGTWVIAGSTPGSLVVWQNSLVEMDSAGGVFQQTGVSYVEPDGSKCAASFEIAGARLNGVEGFGRARGAKLLFDSDSGATIQVQVKDDYSDTIVQTADPMTLDTGQDSFEVRFINQKVSAVGLVVTEIVSGDGLSLEGIVFDVGILAGTSRKNPSTKRTS